MRGADACAMSRLQDPCPLMDDVRLGGLFRAVRVLMRLRQDDVAGKARLGVKRISRLEHGHVDELGVLELRAIARALDIRLELVPRWRGADLDRMLDARHASLHEELAARLERCPGWESAAEVSFSIFGERGVIDRLAYHRGAQMLSVFELKSVLADISGLMGQTDRYCRLAPIVARDRGWAPVRAVSCWVLVADTDTNRRRLAAHSAVLRGSYPADGRRLRRWLKDPVDRVSGLGFIAERQSGAGKRTVAGVRRVRAAQDTPN